MPHYTNVTYLSYSTVTAECKTTQTRFPRFPSPCPSFTALVNHGALALAKHREQEDDVNIKVRRRLVEAVHQLLAMGQVNESP